MKLLCINNNGFITIDLETKEAKKIIKEISWMKKHGIGMNEETFQFMKLLKEGIEKVEKE